VDFYPSAIPLNLTNVTAIVFGIFVIVHLLWFIMRAPRVDEEVLCAGIATYLMLGLLWTFAHILVARLAPGSFVVAGPPDSPRSLVRPIWVGSAVFDERVGLSRTTGQITHVTAPDVDAERDSCSSVWSNLAIWRRLCHRRLPQSPFGQERRRRSVDDRRRPIGRRDCREVSLSKPQQMRGGGSLLACIVQDSSCNLLVLRVLI
jgi:hypothetical protein